MADNLFFSRDTRVIVSDRHASATYWEIPVLDGFSFSQATNTSEITLNEMEAAAGGSRRGRRCLTTLTHRLSGLSQLMHDPFTSAPGQRSGWESGSDAHMHCVEEALWAALVGNAAFTKSAAQLKQSGQD